MPKVAELVAQLPKSTDNGVVAIQTSDGPMYGTKRVLQQFLPQYKQLTVHNVPRNIVEDLLVAAHLGFIPADSRKVLNMRQFIMNLGTPLARFAIDSHIDASSVPLQDEWRGSEIVTHAQFALIKDIRHGNKANRTFDVLEELHMPFLWFELEINNPEELKRVFRNQGVAALMRDDFVPHLISLAKRTGLHGPPGNTELAKIGPGISKEEADAAGYIHSLEDVGAVLQKLITEFREILSEA